MSYIIIGIVAISISINIYSYINVSGNEIVGVNQISNKDEVIIAKSYMQILDEEAYTLTEEGIIDLKNLLGNSKFTRVMGNSVRYFDKDDYMIIINFADSYESLRIHVIGNEYISMGNQFKGKFLKIQNEKLKKGLEDILVISNITKE